MERSIVPGVKKIAIFRATALGDFVFALPAIRAIYETYPRAEITYLGREWHAQFIPGRLAGVTRVIAVPPARGEQIAKGLVIDPEDEPTFLQRMRAERFDLAFQMQGGGKFSNGFIGAFEAKVSAGARAVDAPLLDRWIPYTYYQPEITRLLDIAALAGAHTSTTLLQPRLAPLSSDLDQAAPVFERLSGTYVVIHAGSTDPRRRWSAEHYAQVANYCWQQYRLEVVLTGVSHEAAQIADLERAVTGPVRNLSGALSLPTLLALLSRASLFIGNDSGPLHLALAAGAACIGLFWAEYAINSLPLSRERFLPLIAWDRTCPACGTFVNKREADTPRARGCEHRVSFVDSISPEEVIAAVDQMATYTGLSIHKADRSPQPR